VGFKAALLVGGHDTVSTATTFRPNLDDFLQLLPTNFGGVIIRLALIARPLYPM
jgi:hypothetical protein